MRHAADIPLRSETHKYLDERTLGFLKHLSFSARGAVDGAYTGKHKSLLKGHSQEFTDYREYMPGDDIRKIDWKVYGRTDRYVIKLCEQETVMTCHLLVDCSASMAFGGSWHEKFFGAGDVSKYDYACYLSAALSYLLLKQGDRVSMTLFGSNIEQHLPAGSTFSHLDEIVHALEGQKVRHKTSLSRVLQQASSLASEAAGNPYRDLRSPGRSRDAVRGAGYVSAPEFRGRAVPRSAQARAGTAEPGERELYRFGVGREADFGPR
jgi:uncharacterized protein (DUF58 family)